MQGDSIAGESSILKSLHMRYLKMKEKDALFYIFNVKSRRAGLTLSYSSPFKLW